MILFAVVPTVSLLRKQASLEHPRKDPVRALRSSIPPFGSRAAGSDGQATAAEFRPLPKAAEGICG